MPTPKDAGGAKSRTNEWAALAEAAGSPSEQTSQAEAAENGGNETGEWARVLSEDHFAVAEAPAVTKPDAADEGPELEPATEAAEPPTTTESQEDDGSADPAPSRRGLSRFFRRPGMTKREKRRIEEIEAQLASLTESHEVVTAAGQAAIAELRSSIEAAEAAASREAAELRTSIAVFSDETAADVARQIDELRNTIRSASEAGRAELERFGANLDSKLKDAKAEIDASVASHGEQIAQIDDHVAKILGGLNDEAAALRKRIQAVESASGSAKADLQDLALRIERGLVEAFERLASVADGLEHALGEKIGAVQRSATEDSIALGKEIHELRAIMQGVVSEFAAEEDADLEAGLGGLAAKVRGIDSAFSSVLERLDAILSGRGQPSRTPTVELEPGQTVALNSATFEELRAVGLSVTQTARLLAFRDTHGGFRDPEQLREVRGLSSEDLQMLTERTSL